MTAVSWASLGRAFPSGVLHKLPPPLLFPPLSRIEATSPSPSSFPFPLHGMSSLEALLLLVVCLCATGDRHPPVQVTTTRRRDEVMPPPTAFSFSPIRGSPPPVMIKTRGPGKKKSPPPQKKERENNYCLPKRESGKVAALERSAPFQ
eukprot:Sspe_Gene.46795::Locus_23493_Transcript_2_2_Confidence_0.400_Length_789::g.46795::m.46795